MSIPLTNAELFEMAIALEHEAEKPYRGLEARFAHQPEIARYWGAFAADESQHARTLEKIRDGLCAAQRSAPADSSMQELGHQLSTFSAERALATIRNLQDAYQLPHELEFGETNTLFAFLVSGVSTDGQPAAFVK